MLGKDRPLLSSFRRLEISLQGLRLKVPFHQQSLWKQEVFCVQGELCGYVVVTRLQLQASPGDQRQFKWLLHRLASLGHESCAGSSTKQLLWVDGFLLTLLRTKGI